MGNLVNKYKWMTLVSGIILIIASALIITISVVNVEALSKTLSIVIAILLFLFGGIMILSSFIEDRRSFFSSPLAYGSILIAVGVVLCILPTLIGEFIIYFIAVFCLAFGVVEVAKGVFLILGRSPWYYYVLTFVIAAIAITFGIISLVVKPDDMLRVVYIFMGSLVGLFGILTTISGIQRLRK